MRKVKIVILNWCLRKLWNAVTSDSFLKIEVKSDGTGRVVEGSELLNKTHVLELASEARTILALPLYTKLTKSMKFTSNEMMYEKSKTIDDMIFGKALLWTLEVIDEKLKLLARVIK